MTFNLTNPNLPSQRNALRFFKHNDNYFSFFSAIFCLIHFCLPYDVYCLILSNALADYVTQIKIKLYKIQKMLLIFRLVFTLPAIETKIEMVILISFITAILALIPLNNCQFICKPSLWFFAFLGNDSE